MVRKLIHNCRNLLFPDSPSGRRGCSLVEPFFWTFGYLFAQLFVLIAVVTLFLIAAYGLHWPDEHEILNLMLETNIDRSFLLVGTTSVGVLLLIFPLVRLREGPQVRDRLGWQAPSRQQIVYALATVLPVAILGNITYEVANHWLQQSSGHDMLHQSTLQQLTSRIHGVSFPILVIALGLAPAVGEEIVFRGVLGRRLVNRFGLLTGVMVGSLCFAFAHGSPAHAIATIPIAIVLQILYYQTGSIWIPILVHFANNLFAVSFMKFDWAVHATISPMLTATLLLHLIAILCLMQAKYSNQHWKPTKNSIG